MTMNSLVDNELDDKEIDKYIKFLQKSFHTLNLKTVGSIQSDEESDKSNIDKEKDQNNKQNSKSKQRKLIQQQKLELYKQIQQEFQELDYKKGENKEQKQAEKLDLKDKWRNEMQVGINTQEEEDYINEYKEQIASNTQSPLLEIVEMNKYQRISIYPEFTLSQRIVKKILYACNLISLISRKIVKNTIFEAISLLVILGNSILLAMDDPTTSTDNNADIDLALLIIYTIEMVLKIIAFGFVMEKKSYLRDAWNFLDLIIIVTGWIPYIVTSNSVNLNALRSLRVLRPLKTISKLKALQSILTTLFSSLPLMKDAILLLSFYYIVFAIAGLQLFQGIQKKRCVDILTGVQYGDDLNSLYLCADDSDCYTFNEKDVSNYVCAKVFANPKYDTSSFDSIGWSVLNVYIIVSLEGWADLQEYVQQSFSYFALFYFFFCIFIGTFFLMNLMMAILEVKYHETQEAQKVKISINNNNIISYDFKDFVKWGLYKSNKQRYKEIEIKLEQIKLKKQKSILEKNKVKPLSLPIPDETSRLKNDDVNSPAQNNNIGSPNFSYATIEKSPFMHDKSPLMLDKSPFNEKSPSGKLKSSHNPSFRKSITMQNNSQSQFLQRQTSILGQKNSMKSPNLKTPSSHHKKGDQFENYSQQVIRKNSISFKTPEKFNGTEQVQENGLKRKNSVFFNSSKFLQQKEEKNKTISQYGIKSSGLIANLSKMRTIKSQTKKNEILQIGQIREKQDSLTSKILDIPSQFKINKSQQPDKGSQDYKNSSINSFENSLYEQRSTKKQKIKNKTYHKSDSKDYDQSDDRTINQSSESASVRSKYKKMTFDKPPSNRKIEILNEDEQQKNSPSKLLIPSQFSFLRVQEEQEQVKDKTPKRKKFHNSSFFQNSLRDRSVSQRKTQLMEMQKIKRTSIEDMNKNSFSTHKKHYEYDIDEEEKDERFFRLIDKALENYPKTNQIERGQIPTFNELELQDLQNKINTGSNKDTQEQTIDTRPKNQSQQVGKTNNKEENRSRNWSLQVGKNNNGEYQKESSKYNSNSKQKIEIYTQGKFNENQANRSKSNSNQSIYQQKSFSSQQYKSQSSDVSSVSQFDEIELFKDGKIQKNFDKQKGILGQIQQNNQIISNDNTYNNIQQNNQNTTFDEQFKNNNDDNSKQNIILSIQNTNEFILKKNQQVIFNDEDFINKFQIRQMSIKEKHNQIKTQTSTTFKDQTKEKSKSQDQKGNKEKKIEKLLIELEDDNYQQIMGMDIELLKRKHFIAKVNYLEPSNYTEQILSKQIEQRKQQKRIEHERKIKNIRNKIIYMLTQYNTHKHKKDNKINKNIQFPVRKSKLIDQAFQNEFQQWLEGQQFSVDQWIDFSRSLSLMKSKRQSSQQEPKLSLKKMSKDSESQEYNQDDECKLSELNGESNTNQFGRRSKSGTNLKTKVLADMRAQKRKSTSESSKQNRAHIKKQLSNKVFPFNNEVLNSIEYQNFQTTEAVQGQNKEVQYGMSSDKLIKSLSIKSSHEQEQATKQQRTSLAMELSSQGFKKTGFDTIIRQITKQSNNDFPVQDAILSDQSSHMSTSSPLKGFDIRPSENKIILNSLISNTSPLTPTKIVKFPIKKERANSSSLMNLGSSQTLKNKSPLISSKGKGNIPIKEWNLQKVLNIIFPEAKEQIGENEKDYFNEDGKDTCTQQSFDLMDSTQLDGLSEQNKQEDKKKFQFKRSELIKKIPTLGFEQNSLVIQTQPSLNHTNTSNFPSQTTMQKSQQIQYLQNNNTNTDKKEDAYDADDEINLRLELFLKEPINKNYLQIRNYDLQAYENKKPNQLVRVAWSGMDVLKVSILNKTNSSLLKVVNALNYSKDDLQKNQPGLHGLIQSFRLKIKKLTNSHNYETCLLIFVAINTIMLSLDGLPQIQSSIFDNFNFTATIIFTLDMVLKIIGFGFKEYLTDKMNLFDSFIVFLSLTELVFLNGTGGSFNAFRSVRIVRIFRVLRITRLLRQLQFMKIIIIAMSTIIEQVMYILLLVVLFVFIYTLLGMQLYGGIFIDTNINRFNFDGFFIASLSIFDLLTLENWNEMLTVALRSSNDGFITPLFFISCTFIGNYILMNLLLAIMIGAFDTEEIKTDRNEIEKQLIVVEDLQLNDEDHNKPNSQQLTSKSNTTLQDKQEEPQQKSTIIKKDSLNNNSSSNIQKNSTLAKQSTQNLQKGNTFTDQNVLQAFQQRSNSIFHRKYTKIQLKELDGDDDKDDDDKSDSGSESNLDNSSYKQNENDSNHDGKSKQNTFDKKMSTKKQTLVKKKIKSPQKKELFKNIECERSLFIFSKQNKFRKACYLIITDQRFEKIIMMGIIISSLKLVSDTYAYEIQSTSQSNYDTFNTVSKNLDIVITLFFTCEAAMKIIVQGFFLDQNSFLRENWSQLDFFIVICSLIDISVESINLGAIKILRLLRTLRPLRILSHNKSMKLIVTSLMESVSSLFNIIIVIFILWLMFAILGVNLMRGKMNYCKFPSDGKNYSIFAFNQEQIDIYTNIFMQKCLTVPGAYWATYDINFENTVDGLITLFVLSTMEGWPVYCLNFMDGSDKGPIQYESAYFGIFIVVFIFVGSFFSVNLFGAVMAFNYDIASKKSKNKYLTEEQAQWIELQHLILKSTPDFASIKPPSNKFRKLIWNISESWYLEVFITICIVANIITMAMIYESAPTNWNENLATINLFFTAIFIGECILHIISYGFSGYLYKDSNKFDFFVVLASLVDIVLSYTGRNIIKFVSAGPQLARIFRVFRVTRLLRIVDSLKNLQKLIMTAIYALPALMNAISLLLLVYFIFSVLGCYLFQSYNQGDELNNFWNFSTFHRSFILLFRQSTGENWYVFMFDVIHNTNKWSVLFFILFITTQQYIMMNLFVLIIIDQFQQNYINPDNPLNNFKEQEQNFKKVWVKLTQEEHGVKIHEKALTDLYFQIEQPLGFDYQQCLKQFLEKIEQISKDMTENEKKLIIERFRIRQVKEAEKRIMQMNIYCDYEGYIYFNELLYSFFRYSILNNLTKNMNEFETMEELEKYMKATEIIRTEEKSMQKKIRNLKKKQSKLTKQKYSHKRSQGVNPIVKRFFIGLCFRTWNRYSTIQMDKLENLEGQVDDISSQSDTDDQEEENADIIDYLKQDQTVDDFINSEFNFKLKKNISNYSYDNSVISNNKQGEMKRKIIPRQHTFNSRSDKINSSNTRDKSMSIIRSQKPIFLPDTDIYKDVNYDISESNVQGLPQNQNGSISQKINFTSMKNQFYKKKKSENDFKLQNIQNNSFVDLSEYLETQQKFINSTKNNDNTNIQFSLTQMRQELFETTDFLDVSKNVELNREFKSDLQKNNNGLEQIQENDD